MKVIVYNGYPLSVFVAVTLHSLVLAGLLYLQAAGTPDVLDIVQPAIVKAILINENPQLRNEELLEQQRLVRLDDQRKAREEQRKQQAEEEQRQQQAEAEAQRQKEQEVQQQREREARQQKEREAVARNERQEKERREAELLRKQREDQKQREQEQQRQRDLAADQERQRQTDAAAAEVARTEYEMVQSYSSIVHDLVQQNWSRPPSARNGMTAVFRIRMLPTGDVLDVGIIESSGDPAFDSAAERAIHRAGTFRELQGMPTNIFNENFRTFLLTFRPEDLLN